MKVLDQYLCKIALTVLAILLAGANAIASQVRVCIACPVNDLVSAVALAQPHDTVLVEEGLYRTKTIEIRKPLKMMALDSVTIRGFGDHEIFVIYSDSVEINGFTIQHVEANYLKDRAAVHVVDCNYSLIENNIIEDAFFGIYLQNAKYCSILSNKIFGNAIEEYSSGNAIHVWKAEHVAIKNNITTGHRDGIYFEFVDNSVIEDNVCRNNLRYGLHFMFSDNDEYRRNHFQENGVGVAVMFSHSILMQENIFLQNWGGTSYGVLLKEINDGTLVGNIFENNTTGIYMEGTNRITITENQFAENGWAIDLKGNCQQNNITKNNFLSNTFEIVSNSRESSHNISYNYWSHYRGYDLNHDGEGDVPHFPVSIFALLVEEIPASSLFLHSFLQHFLDASERVFPSIIPKKLVDVQPMMKPYSYD